MKNCYHYAIIGDPVEHSRSPELYEPMFKQIGMDAEFMRIRIPKDKIADIRNIVLKYQLSGFAVTMPHKQSIMNYLDKINPEAAAACAVNIVTTHLSITDGSMELVGHNTDGDGLVCALTEAGVSILNKSVIILGNGGAASGAKEALQRNGARCLYNITRNDVKSLNSVILENAESIEECDILINATPLGMKGYPDFESFDFLDLMKPDASAIDMVYNSSANIMNSANTRFTHEAKKRGLLSFCGDKMLRHQGLIAFKLWTGHDLTTINH